MRSVTFLAPLLAGASLLMSPVQAQMPPGGMAHMIAPMGTVLTVQAEAQVRSEPDIATLSTGVMTTAITGKDALGQNAVRMTAMLAALKAAGVADRDVQTSGITLQPQYAYINNQPPRLTGYQASNGVNVTVRRLDSLGSVIDAMASKGASNLNGPNFMIDKPEPLLDRARTEAVQTAMQRAEVYARAAKLKVKRIVSIQEGAAEAPQPMMQQRVMATSAAKDVETPVAFGRIALSAAITVTFELEP